MQRIALGVSYRGVAYHGWQSQPDGNTVQDRLEAALAAFADRPVRTSCAGRTDAGVHALNQVVHFDTEVSRAPGSWVRGTNRFLPPDIAVQWCRPVPASFHSRASARGRRYVYVLRESPVRPALEAGLVGWSFRRLDLAVMQDAAQCLLGEHDFGAFRSSECQAASPVKVLRAIGIEQRGAYWHFAFDANAFLHHMVRNIMGSLVAVGSGLRAPGWLGQVLAARDRTRAAPTFAPDGLYFRGPYYDAADAIPDRTAADDWLP
ncbi:tRNA pseudouridine(38-40) synthase TruA [Piscinibacter koreensis]|uniref:tRNA pseudouridine synthase A n=1 Tax=Piscinibacter koreensis TaxID=2742824 RepID=A0A7Y6NL34_9BURK|nr:tRNA pseudouridine(38-40) synthase TruA [Schlegelella koreensis]